MTKQIQQKILKKVTQGLLSLNAVEHKKPKLPTKADLNKKFVMRVGRNGKVEMREVKD